MGRTSKRLHRKLKAAERTPRRGGHQRRDVAELPDVEELIEGGLDPTHAGYVLVQHIAVDFAEGVSQFPEMRKFAKIVTEAEDEYLPSGPPMSPLTKSFFSSWMLFDLRFEGVDTLATCLIDANDVVSVNPDQLDALHKMANSRMGVYEHLGTSGELIRLRELITGMEYVCYCTSGYQGKKGELWYVRLLPPLMPELASFHITFTTPYVLIANTKKEWNQFLQRSMRDIGESGKAAALHELLKYGPDVNYWNEFVFKGFHRHQHDAIFLAGIPDLEATLPHA